MSFFEMLCLSGCAMVLIQIILSIDLCQIEVILKQISFLCEQCHPRGNLLWEGKPLTPKGR